MAKQTVTYKQDDDIFEVDGAPELVDPEQDVSNDERSAIFKYTVKCDFEPTHEAEDVCLAVQVNKIPPRVTLTGVDASGSDTQNPVYPDPSANPPIPDTTWTVVTKGKKMRYSYKEKSSGKPYSGEIVEKGGKYYKDDETTLLECEPPQDLDFYIKVRTGIFANNDMNENDDYKNTNLSAAIMVDHPIPVRIHCRYHKVVKETVITFDREDDLVLTITD